MHELMKVISPVGDIWSEANEVKEFMNHLLNLSHIKITRNSSVPYRLDPEAELNLAMKTKEKHFNISVRKCPMRHSPNWVL